MQIAQHFRAFLEEHSFLALPGIGKFEVVNDIVETDMRHRYTRKLLQFHSSKVPFNEAESLVNYICIRQKIERHVAISDLECFTRSTNELLMQGLEAEVPGIGFLNTGYHNTLRFSNQSRYLTTKPKVRKLRPAAIGMSFWF